MKRHGFQGICTRERAIRKQDTKDDIDQTTISDFFFRFFFFFFLLQAVKIIVIAEKD
jgi:hypothetical protein